MPFNLHLANIVTALTTVAQINNNHSSISLSDFNAILSTDILSEINVETQIPAENIFGNQSSTLSNLENIWNALGQYEWNYNSKHTTVATPTKIKHLRRSTPNNDDNNQDGDNTLPTAHHPYIICSHTSQSGYDTLLSIQNQFNTSRFSPISNKHDKTCFWAVLPYTKAVTANHEYNNISITPLAPEMKLGQGWVLDDLTLNVEWDAWFCPEENDYSISTTSVVEDMWEEIKNGVMNGMERRRIRHRFLRHDLLETATATSPDDHPRRRLWNDGLTTIDNDEDGCKTFLSEIKITPSKNNDALLLHLPPPSQNETMSSTSCYYRLLAALLTHNHICHVSPHATFSLLNANAQWIVQTGARGSKRSRPWFDVGLTGRNQIIAISDSGVDTDNCYFYDGTGDIAKDGSVDPSRRKIVQYNPYADRYDSSGHGTHVTATAAGRQSKNGRDESVGTADGMARDAKVAFFDIGSWWGGDSVQIPQAAGQLFDPGFRAGARIHSASWGGPTNGYGYQERDIDRYTNDNDDFVMIVAAGNDGEGNRMRSVTSPGLAKNAISVGASQSDGDSLPYRNMMGPSYLASFSSRGPTPDGRLKPDIIAPGHGLVSAGADPNRLNECDERNALLSGTSMATPVVAGVAALVRQYFTEGWYPTGRPTKGNEMTSPSGYLIKAVLLNGARYLKGVQQSNGRVTGVSPYDNNQGFGRVSLMDSLRLDNSNNLNVYVLDRKSIANNEVHNIDLTVDLGTNCQNAELSATLVWNDPPSSVGCRNCVLNDLDLTITKGGGQRNVYYPNGGNQRDDVNNAERVRLTVSDGEQYTVAVRGYDLYTRRQNYALVVTGCFELSDATPTPPAVPTAPVSPPVSSPVTSPPNPAPVVPSNPSQILYTKFTGSRRFHGNMFDVRSRKQSLIITNLAIHTQQTSLVTVEVYTKKGSHVSYENDLSAWTLVTTTQVTGQGSGQPTPIFSSNSNKSLNIAVEARQTVSLYVTLTTDDMMYSWGGWWVGFVTSRNTDLDIMTGTANGYGFGEVWAPRVWNGGVEYVLV